MPRVVLFIATSLVGYIASPESTVDRLNSNIGLNIQVTKLKTNKPDW